MERTANKGFPHSQERNQVLRVYVGFPRVRDVRRPRNGRLARGCTDLDSDVIGGARDGNETLLRVERMVGPSRGTLFPASPGEREAQACAGRAMLAMGLLSFCQGGRSSFTAGLKL